MKLMTLIAMLFSLSAFAGDSYLICEQNDYQLVNTYIGEAGVIKGTENLNLDYIFSYTFNKESFEMEAELIDIHGAGSLYYKKVKLEYYKKVNFFKGLGCYITD